jgi:membrane-bound lytic murein transglycosylase A
MVPVRRRRRAVVLAALLALLPLGGCRHRPPAAQAGAERRLVRAGEAPDLLDPGDREALRQAVDQSRDWLAGRPADYRVTVGERTLDRAEIGRGLVAFRDLLADDPSPEVLAARVRRDFDLYLAEGGPVLVTGYYQPLIDASLEPRPGYPVPIYRPPDDRVLVDLGEFAERFAGERLVGRLDGNRLRPYWDRRQIRGEGRLGGRGLEIAWARDPVDLFFLEIQGSGVLRLPDGAECGLGWAGGNGRPYRSIGKLLIDEGQVSRERMSMQAIRAWLAAHPDEVERVLDYNPSFVFFELGDGLARGSLGRPLTAERSVATDHRVYPPGAIAWLDTAWPEEAADGSVRAGARLSRFVCNQDQGGAIRGADRVDLFFGRGDEAERAAGQMRLDGRLYLLLPKAAATAPAPAAAAAPAAGAQALP